MATINQRSGDLSFPIDATSVTTTLVALDPARVQLMGLFKAAINAEFGTVWTKVVATLPAGHHLRGTQPVQDTLEMEPSHKTMVERKCAFPLLCVYRAGEATIDQRTLFVDQLLDKWSVDYILGPLDVGAVRKVQDICVAILKLIRAVVYRRGHPAYESGALQFFPGKGGFASIEVKRHSGPGQAKFAGDDSGTIYYALSVGLDTAETLEELASEAGDFEATDYSVAVGNATELVPDMIQASTDVTRRAG